MMDRLAETRRLLTERDIGALLVGPSADLRYLVGYHALPLERLTLLMIPADGTPTLLVPELEAPRARDSGAADVVQLRTWNEEENPFDHVEAVLANVGIGAGSTVAVQDRLWSTFLLRLQERIPADRWVAGSEVMRPLRITKSADEVATLRRAGAAIDRVHEQVPELLRIGRTEREVGRDIADLILVDHDEVSFVIVASGANGASPHHETGDRRIEAGDAVVVDIGGTIDGYCSDMTRNYVVGDVPDGYAPMHAALLEAQKAGVAAARPGATAESVDLACRDHLDDAGYGQWFVHRTGHGIGVEEHEHPYIVRGNHELLTPGMAFSVEPGVYLPHRYGARIEDIVVVTEDGAERMNRLDRALVVVDGRGEVVERL